MDFTKVETQCLILQIVQQVSLLSRDIKRTSHALVVEGSFRLAMLQQLEIAL
jgi:hypothetical protein